MNRINKIWVSEKLKDKRFHEIKHAKKINLKEVSNNEIEEEKGKGKSKFSFLKEIKKNVNMKVLKEFGVDVKKLFTEDMK